MASEANRIRRRIDLALLHADCIDDDAVKAEIAKYVCVLVSGLLEATVRDSVRVLVAQQHPSKRIANAANSYSETLQNPSLPNLLRFFQKIDPVLGSDFRNLVEDEKYRSAMNSISSNRNLIAHGRDSQISIRNIKDYYDRVAEIIKLIEKISS